MEELQESRNVRIHANPHQMKPLRYYRLTSRLLFRKYEDGIYVCAIAALCATSLCVVFFWMIMKNSGG